MTVSATPDRSDPGARRPRNTLRLRMILFVSGLTIVLGLVGVTGIEVAGALAARGRDSMIARGEAYQTAYALKSRLVGLAVLLGRYQPAGEGPVRDAILAESNDLLLWFATERSRAGPEARATLDTLVAGLERALADVRELVLNTNLAALEAYLRRSAFGATSAVPRLAVSDALFGSTQRLAMERDFARIRPGLEWWRAWSVASMLLVAVLVAWLGHFLWRDLIAPLRSQVIASDAVIRQQSRLSTLGRFAAGIAHEIRNPLNSIKARLYTQDRALPAASSAREDNRVIHGEVLRLEQIVQDFLAFARPPSPRLERLQASAPLRAAADLLSPELEQQGIHLQLEVRDDPLVRGDAAQLRQVLVNLIRNAAESLPGPGRIVLRCRLRSQARGGARAALAELEVSDTGPGIPQEVQGRLFEAFFTTKPKGTGLGLSIAAQITESHGGRIECETQLNVGTAFRIFLPVATDHAQPSASDPAP